jgi:oligopeptide transport system ATP-binding protein
LGEVLLRVENLKKYFPVREGIFQRIKAYVLAVEDVSFTIDRGETFGLVGESGCGKSTVGKTVLRLYNKDGGKVIFDGIDIHELSRKEMSRLRPRMQIVFQDPYGSLNPRMTAGEIVGEALVEHRICTRRNVKRNVAEVLERCGLLPGHADRYPHEFSAGQRQRIGIARALALKPDFIVCDEPVSALDVLIQSQIISLLLDLQSEYGFSYLFISHDLSLVKYISRRIGVMYLGELVELAEKNDLFSNPMHPYTRALLSAVPVPDPSIKRKRIILPGEAPSPVNPPPGCKFHTRCPYVMGRCKKEKPPARNMGNNHLVACHLL